MNTPAVRIVALDSEGFESWDREFDTIKDAKQFLKDTNAHKASGSVWWERMAEPEVPGWASRNVHTVQLQVKGEVHSDWFPEFPAPSPAPLVAPVPAEPFVAPASGGRVVSVCNEHVLNEWARLATQAYKAGHNEIGHKFSAAATISPDTRVCPKWFDSMQDVYRAWLVFGWTDAVPAFQKAFPSVSA